jgi:DNA-binding beta-propeller fold protein YncE
VPASTLLVGGFSGAIGCAYVPSTHKVVLVEFNTGRIDAIDLATNVRTTLGVGYTNPESIVIASNGDTAYVTERSGDLVSVSLAAANRAGAHVIAGGFNQPQQVALDEPRAQAYVVEYANPGRLLRIDVTTGVTHVVTGALEFPVGVAVTSDGLTAYVSEQSPLGGRIRKVTLATGVVTAVTTGLTAPFFLTWLNASQQALFVPERDPANRISVVHTTGGPPVVSVSPTAPRPSSVAVTSPGELIICCDGEVDQCSLFPPAPGILFLGIGFVPFNGVVATGLANTTGLAGYFYQVANVPFGGTLPLIIDHKDAFAAGARFYRVLVNGAPGLDVWTDLKLNPVTHIFDAVTMTPHNIGPNPGFYPVRNPADVWLNANLGDLLSTTSVPFAQVTIEIEFVTPAGVLVKLSNAIKPLIDNAPCVAALSEATLDGKTADPTCGFLPYTTMNADPVTIAYTAAQPHNHGTYSFELIKGVNVMQAVSGSVPGPGSDTMPLNALMGACKVAGCAVELYVAATAINGWDRQGQYDRSASEAFALAPA